MKILTIIGARPQFIKAGSVSRIIAKYSDIKEIIVHTGQHYDSNMSNVFFNEMRIPKPKYNLGIRAKSHGIMTGRMMEKIEEVVLVEKPDWILVYGDTNSTLAGAIVASKLNIKLAHVEAGLRSFNMQMPEEINRILTDRVSTVLFCPTNLAVKNLQNEGFNNFNCSVIKTGDVMLDGAIFYKKYAHKPSFDISDQFVLATVHRAENTENIENLCSIFRALNEISKSKQLILPLHPRTRKIVEKNNINIDFQIIEPIGYMEMVWLIQHAEMVVTDSGGLQKEAFFFNKPCITLRNETEWLELVEGGYSVLTGSNYSKIIKAVYATKAFKNKPPDLYGDGNASIKIVEYLRNYNTN